MCSMSKIKIAANKKLPLVGSEFNLNLACNVLVHVVLELHGFKVPVVVT